MSIFAFLSIKAMAAHEIFERTKDKQIIKPNMGKFLIPLDATNTKTLQERLVGAMTNDAHCIEMSISNRTTGSTADTVEKLVNCNEKDFAKISERIATNLAESQHSRQIPGGALVIMRGTTGSQQYQYIAIIKAEMQEGFRKRTINGSITLRHVKDLLLTPQQRLYKIGLFVKTGPQATDYRCFVYDQTMTANETKSAAAYFYRVFLGCTFSPTDKKLTSDFYKYTHEFIASLDIDADRKLDLKVALYTYLKTSNSTTIKTAEFSKQYLSKEHIPLFEDHMNNKGFPKTAINKDLSHLKNKLKRRKVKFNSDVKIDAPQNNFKELVRFEGKENGYTKVLIKGNICE